MPLLVDDTEMYDYLTIPSSDDEGGNVPLIRNAVEELLVSETSALFGPEAVHTDEPYDGTGTRVLYLRRPIKLVSSIKFRYGVEALTDYNVDVTNAVVFRVGDRRLALKSYTGVNIVVFPCGYDNILVTYTSSLYQPELAKQAVREVTAAIFRRIGSEDARSEQLGSFHHVLLRSIDELPIWKKAIAVLHQPAIG